MRLALCLLLLLVTSLQLNRACGRMLSEGLNKKPLDVRILLEICTAAHDT